MIVVALFLVGSALRPILIPRLDFFARRTNLAAALLPFASAGFWLGFPLSAISLIGLLQRRFWGRTVAVSALLFTPILAITFFIASPITPPQIMLFGFGLATLFALIGIVGLFVNRRWFDEWLS